MVDASEDSDYYFSQDRRSLTISNLTTDDSGSYTLRATNPAGINSNTIVLEIEGDFYTLLNHIYTNYNNLL